MSTAATPYSALLARLGRDPAAPLITDVDLRSGERVELSVASAANGAIKAAHLVAGVSLDLGRPPLLQLRLPLHWQAVTLAIGAWGAGACLLSDSARADHTSVDAVVLGPEAADLPPAELPELVWASRLHPFGLPLEQPPRYPVEDLTLALRGQPDQPPQDRTRPSDPAVVIDGATTTHEALMTRAHSITAGLGPAPRVLTCLSWATVDGWVAATVLPVVTGGSVLLVRAPEDPVEAAGQFAHLCATEQITATAGVSVPGLPRLT